MSTVQPGRNVRGQRRDVSHDQHGDDQRRDDDAGHDHAGHSHAPTSFGRAFAIGVTLNLGFVLVEALYGLRANSVALLADAGHNLSDVAGLLIAWGASVLASRVPTERRTYGLRSSSILAAVVNAVVLLLATAAIGYEALTRVRTPEPITGSTVAWVAAVGILINGATALMFMSGRKHDLNVRGAYLHMAADAGVSAGVVLAGLLIAATGWVWIDPALSLAIAAFIAWSTVGIAARFGQPRAQRGTGASRSCRRRAATCGNCPV